MGSVKILSLEETVVKTEKYPCLGIAYLYYKSASFSSQTPDPACQILSVKYLFI